LSGLSAVAAVLTGSVGYLELAAAVFVYVLLLVLSTCISSTSCLARNEVGSIGALKSPNLSVKLHRRYELSNLHSFLGAYLGEESSWAYGFDTLTCTLSMISLGVLHSRLGLSIFGFLIPS